MNRRSLLGTLGACTVAASGCLGGQPLGTGSSTSDEIAETTFEVYEYGDEGYENAPGIRDPPDVEFRPDVPAIVVTGTFFVGSSSCKRASLAGISDTTESDGIEVRIETETTAEGSGLTGTCTGDEHPDAYRLVVTFADDVPEAVTVSESRGTETTVER